MAAFTDSNKLCKAAVVASVIVELSLVSDELCVVIRTITGGGGHS